MKTGAEYLGKIEDMSWEELEKEYDKVCAKSKFYEKLKLKSLAKKYDYRAYLISMVGQTLFPELYWNSPRHVW